MKKIYPLRNQVYSYKQIAKELELRDSPFLCFYYQNKEGVIQTSHLTEEQLESVSGMLDTQWKYIRETHEWIPIFNYTGPIESLLAVIDLEPYDDKTFPERNDTTWWATPKGFPRKQYE